MVHFELNQGAVPGPLVLLPGRPVVVNHTPLETFHHLEYPSHLLHDSASLFAGEIEEEDEGRGRAGEQASPEHELMSEPQFQSHFVTGSQLPSHPEFGVNSTTGRMSRGYFDPNELQILRDRGSHQSEQDDNYNVDYYPHENDDNGGRESR